VKVKGAALNQGRAAFRRGSWGTAFDALSVADAEHRLAPEDLERLATAAWMNGRDADAERAWLRAHDGHARRGDPARAARCAFWQATCLLFRGDGPPAMGWIARARRLLGDGGADTVERGWLLTVAALPLAFEGDAETSLPQFTEATRVADRYGDEDLSVLANLGLAVAMAGQSRTAEAVSVLDEIMVRLPSGQISPVMVGIAYCQAIDICHRTYELGRAREWTDALSQWCDAQPGLVPYRGNCLVHRCEILQMRGAWRDALEAAESATALLSGPGYWDSLGSAFYQLGEIRRLRGEFGRAEKAYRRASQAGRDPEPGMSLLRLAQGPPMAASAAIRRALSEARDPLVRARILPAHVEIMIATRDLVSARAAATELRRLADARGAPYLGALADDTMGAVLLAEKEPQRALPDLRVAHASWRALDAPYQAARVRERIGLACRALGDHASAALEFEAARKAYRELRAGPDLERLDRLTGGTSPRAAGLTARELEVVTLIAAGKSNRAIADDLTISQKTVARHVSNIFTKLDLSSRAEATAYAYEHGLV
jgi:DNA-binding CsgD family transcriptional regulator